MPLTSAEHARRLDILLKGKEAGLTIEAMAHVAGIYAGTFWNWAKRYYPSHMPPSRQKAAEPQPALPWSKMLKPEVVALRHRVWEEGSARRDTWAAMAKAAGVGRNTFKEWAYRNRPDAVALYGEPDQGVTNTIARDVTPRAITTKTHTTRPCMTCGDPFKSEGAHNRMCGECRTRPVSPLEPDYGRGARQMPARRA